MDDIKLVVIGIGVFILATILIIGIIDIGVNKENTITHDDDLAVTEWISPDGVHYWYQYGTYGTYGRMLAPRYDANGNLVIDMKGE